MDGLDGTKEKKKYRVRHPVLCANDSVIAMWLKGRMPPLMLFSECHHTDDVVAHLPPSLLPLWRPLPQLSHLRNAGMEEKGMPDVPVPSWLMMLMLESRFGHVFIPMERGKWKCVSPRDSLFHGDPSAKHIHGNESIICPFWW